MQSRIKIKMVVWDIPHRKTTAVPECVKRQNCKNIENYVLYAEIVNILQIMHLTIDKAS